MVFETSRSHVVSGVGTMQGRLYSVDDGHCFYFVALLCYVYYIYLKAVPIVYLSTFQSVNIIILQNVRN